MIIAIPTNNSGIKSEVPSRTQNAAYCKYVADAGFDPILVPMEADPNTIASISDGLLLAGGIDVDPIYYGVSNTASFSTDPQRDNAERNLLHAFRVESKPVFGICRGFQLMFREFIHLHEDYGDYLGYIEHLQGHAQKDGLGARRDVPTHLVRANTKSLFGESVTTKEENKMVPVNSMHHQVAVINYMQVALETNPDAMKNRKVLSHEPTILNIGNFELVAWTMRGVKQPMTNNKPDTANNWAIIEAMKLHRWGGPMMGVQWHPEELRDVKLIKNFFDPEEEQVITGLT